MSYSVVHTRALNGIDAPAVTVETHLANGLPAFSIVGLPEAAVRESRDRVRAALLNSHFEFPARRITVNLAPADLPKEGGRFDLPIALGILVASGQLDAPALDTFEFVGELTLGGDLRAVPGVLPVAVQTRHSRRSLILPAVNRDEAALVRELAVYPAENLLAVCAHLNGSTPLARQAPTAVAHTPPNGVDLAEVRAQHQARRALEVAAAGGHNLLFFGTPGTGKSMLATRLPGILPPLSEAEALETAAVYSISGKPLPFDQWAQRPFRRPHHTASGVALVGGGSHPRPGEISLAHNGILFLDELPEFDRRVLEVLREPLETGTISISRAARQAEFPARFQLLAAMNPCPCGYLGHPEGRCRCTPEQIQRYRARISGPLLDRIDMHVEVPPLPRGTTHGDDNAAPPEDSASVRVRVVAAHERQLARAGTVNARLEPGEIRRYCALDEDDHRLLESAIDRLGLSARATDRILRVARTIADLDDSESIATAHLGEALSYRQLDRRRTPQV
ncbi:MAG TPA: ATP-dependent protease [Gammaproteobacteria bacterium]|nr:ATP-dependent protease [Gammaproteobacteria bacterium]